jgi:uncharacterized protein (DUF305 family)
MPPHGIGADHGGPGLLAEKEVERLVATPRRSFDSLFLDLMVRHHRGGTQITRAQIADGRNPEAVALARRIHAEHAAAIKEMLTLRQDAGRGR